MNRRMAQSAARRLDPRKGQGQYLSLADPDAGTFAPPITLRRLGQRKPDLDQDGTIMAIDRTTTFWVVVAEELGTIEPKVNDQLLVQGVKYAVRLARGLLMNTRWRLTCVKVQ